MFENVENILNCWEGELDVFGKGFGIVLEVLGAGVGVGGVSPFAPNFPPPKIFGHLSMLFWAGGGWIRWFGA